jgi:hypothetical protein
MTETATGRIYPILDGSFTYAGLPPASENAQHLAWVSDVMGGCYMASNGTTWEAIINRRVELYAGVTDASGNYTVTYAKPFPVGSQIQPVGYPPIDADTRVRVISESTTGFTIRSEKNVGLVVLGITLLGFGTNPVPGVQVRVIAVSS